MTPVQQADLLAHPATRRLASLVEERWEEWGGRAANNIGWAQAVLGHGSPTLMSKVLDAASSSCAPWLTATTSATRRQPLYVAAMPQSVAVWEAGDALPTERNVRP